MMRRWLLTFTTALLLCPLLVWAESFSPDGGCTLVTSLTAHWDLDEASGTRVDAKGANDLTDNNTVTQATGIVSNAAQFTSATTEYLSLADNAALSTGDIDYTFAAWVYLDTIAGDTGIVNKHNTLNQKEYMMTTTTTQFRWFVSNDGTAESNVLASTFGNLSTATWYFVVVYHDSVNNLIGISVNNGAFDTTAHSTGSFDSTSPFELGRRDDAGATVYLNGRMDETGFWKKMLTSQELTDLYNGGSGNTYNAAGDCRRRVMLISRLPWLAERLCGAPPSPRPGSIGRAIHEARARCGS